MNAQCNAISNAPPGQHGGSNVHCRQVQREQDELAVRLTNRCAFTSVAGTQPLRPLQSWRRPCWCCGGTDDVGYGNADGQVLLEPRGKGED